MAFIMLNPSTADASEDDNTIRRCIAFAKRDGCNRIQVVNLFGLRSTDPKRLKGYENPELDLENTRYIQRVVQDAKMHSRVVCAWGAHPLAQVRGSNVTLYAASIGVTLNSLGTTLKGAPRHPLYVRSDQPFEPFN